MKNLIKYTIKLPILIIVTFCIICIGLVVKIVELLIEIVKNRDDLWKWLKDTREL